jgi:predicted kinase
MDLLAHGRGGLAFRFLDRYLEASGDHGGLAVLRPYLVYRALVRAMVTALHPDGAPDYLGLALRWLRPPGARLLITHGVSGAGKSWVAERLLESAGAVRLRSDVERKRLFGLGPLASSAAVAGGIYGAGSSELTYARLRERAAVALQAGWPLIVDATFLRRAERASFRQLACEHGAPFTVLHCEAPPAVLRERIAARQRRADDASEADAAVLDQQLQWSEPLSAAERAEAIVLDTTAPFDAAGLAARWQAHAGGR